MGNGVWGGSLKEIDLIYLYIFAIRRCGLLTGNDIDSWTLAEVSYPVVGDVSHCKCKNSKSVHDTDA